MDKTEKFQITVSKNILVKAQELFEYTTIYKIGYAWKTNAHHFKFCTICTKKFVEIIRTCDEQKIIKRL